MQHALCFQGNLTKLQSFQVPIFCSRSGGGVSVRALLTQLGHRESNKMCRKAPNRKEDLWKERKQMRGSGEPAQFGWTDG